MAQNTKLQDETLISTISDKSQVYVEKETVEDGGDWQPFKATFAKIRTWLGVLGDLTGDESDKVPSVRAVKTEIDAIKLDLAGDVLPYIVRAFVADVNLIATGETILVPAKAGYRFVPVLSPDGATGRPVAGGSIIITNLDGFLTSGASFKIGDSGDDDRICQETNTEDIGLLDGSLNKQMYLPVCTTDQMSTIEMTNPIQVKVTTAAVLDTATEYRCQVIIYGFYLQLV